MEATAPDANAMWAGGTIQTYRGSSGFAQQVVIEMVEPCAQT